MGLPARCAGQWPGPSSLFVGVALATYLLAERNLRRRSTEIWDNVLLGVCGLITILVVPHVAGLDMRFGWPPIARYIEVLALLLNIYGWALHIWAMRSNADFAIVVRLQQDSLARLGAPSQACPQATRPVLG